jgi:PAS domain S-box-containing protein
MQSSCSIVRDASPLGTRARSASGYRAEEIIGRHFSCFYRVEDSGCGELDRELQAAIAEGSFSGEGWRVRKDGSEFWASVLITAIRDDRGNLRGFAKLTHDITERRQAEAALDRETEERERAEGILRQAQKMDVLASSALGGLDDREAGKANILGRGVAQ